MPFCGELFLIRSSEGTVGSTDPVPSVSPTRCELFLQVCGEARRRELGFVISRRFYLREPWCEHNWAIITETATLSLRVPALSIEG